MLWTSVNERTHRLVKRWLLRIVWTATLIVATVVIGGAVSARRRLPDLQPWHRYLPADATATNLANASFADDLRREEAVLADVRARASSTHPPVGRRRTPTATTRGAGRIRRA